MVMIAGDQLDTLHGAAMWRLTLDHFTKPIGFVTCSELQATAQTYRHSESGDLIGEEYIGGFEFSDLTLERGFDQDEQMANWWRAICRARLGLGSLPSQYKHDGEFILLNFDGTEGPKWDLHKTFIKEFKASGGMDANSKAAPIVTSMVLGMKYWDYRGLT
jgi:phage tail-like protein